MLAEREATLQALAAALKSAAAGGRVVLVGGEAGIGKTSVLRAAAAAWRATGGPVWWGACDALQTPHPLAPLLDMARDGGARFGATLGGPRPALFEAVLDELRAVAMPVLVVVEDAHWADDATLDWLKHLGRRVERTHAVLAISFRDDEVTARHPLRGVLGELPPAAVTRLNLPRLTPAAVEALARGAARSAAGLHEATRGNPFFVTEVLRDDSGLAVPRTVQDVVLARYARLPDAAQALVRRVAVVPGRAERWLIEAMQDHGSRNGRDRHVHIGEDSGQDSAHDNAEDAALASGLLVADAAGLGFRHELGRVAVESSLSAGGRQHLHAEVLAVLSAASSAALSDSGRAAPAAGRVHDALQARPVPDALQARLVHHALQARDQAAISRWAPRAAVQATERNSMREACAHWRAALQHGRPADDAEHGAWLEAHANAASAVGDIAETVQGWQDAEALALRLGDTATAAMHRSRRAVAMLTLLRHAEARAANQAAVAMVAPLPPSPFKARIWANEAFLCMIDRDCAAGLRWAEEATAQAEAAQDPLARRAALSVQGACLLFIDPARGRDILLDILAAARASGPLRNVGVLLMTLGSGLGEIMALADAETFLREGRALALAHELDSLSAYTGAWLALCRLGRGGWDEAAALASEALARSRGSDMSRLVAMLALARLRVRRGDPGATEMLAAALALAEPSGSLQRLGPARAARAEAAMARGDPAAAAAEVAAALPLAQQCQHAWLIGELAYWGWRAGTVTVAPAGAAEPYALQIAGRWQEAADAWLALDCPYERARALADGDSEAQRQALAVFDALGARPAADALRRRLRDAGVRGVARGARASTRSHPLGLTAAEVQVLRQLAAGLRNAQIAEQLHRSVRTVDHHVASVLAKLGAASRQDAVKLAESHGWWGEPPQSG